MQGRGRMVQSRVSRWVLPLWQAVGQAEGRLAGEAEVAQGEAGVVVGWGRLWGLVCRCPRCCTPWLSCCSR